MNEETKIVSKKQRKSRKPKEPKYWGLTWLTLKEAAEKIICSTVWLLEKVKENKVPCRPWGKTYRFITRELDTWEGTEKGNAKKSPVVPKVDIIKEKDGEAWLTLEWAAKKLKVSTKWLKKVGIKKGIPHKKFGREYRFTVDALDNFSGFTNVTQKKEKKPQTQTEPVKDNSDDSLVKGFDKEYR